MTTDDNNKKAVAVVTGSSSGIGYETSLLLAKNGFFTYATIVKALPIRYNCIYSSED
jgi:NAD(P)-dependent dehydrogenase (short-subunit alcohol dehydrogenase family)